MNKSGNINGILWSDPSDGSTYVSKEGATYPAMSLQPNLTTLGNSTIPLNLGGSYFNMYAKGTSVISGSSSLVQLGNDSIATQVAGSTMYIGSKGGCTLAADGDIDIRGGAGKFGMYVYSGGTLTGLMVANDANADSSKHCYMDLAYNGNIYLSGKHLYFNGTQIA